MSRWTGVALALAAVLIWLWVWQPWLPRDERQIRRRLHAFAADFNESTTDGLGTVARAARFGSYFTDDVVIEFGQGTPPVHGRETVMGMATRLQPRTAAFTLQLLDVNIVVSSPAAAEVNVTAAFRRRSLATGEESIEAQELRLAMVKVDGDWRVSRVTAVEAFK
jgi:SnoaL-like protein